MPKKHQMKCLKYAELNRNSQCDFLIDTMFGVKLTSSVLVRLVDGINQCSNVQKKRQTHFKCWQLHIRISFFVFFSKNYLQMLVKLWKHKIFCHFRMQLQKKPAFDMLL